MSYSTAATKVDCFFEVETDTPGTFARICGINSSSIDRSSETASTSLPHCTDLSKPNLKLTNITGLGISISASGLMARQSSDMLLRWYYSGQAKRARIAHLHAAVGEIEFETFDSILTSLGDEIDREGSDAVQRKFDLESAGEITTADKV